MENNFWMRIITCFCSKKHKEWPTAGSNLWPHMTRYVWIPLYTVADPDYGINHSGKYVHFNVYLFLTSVLIILLCVWNINPLSHCCVFGMKHHCLGWYDAIQAQFQPATTHGKKCPNVDNEMLLQRKNAKYARQLVSTYEHMERNLRIVLYTIADSDYGFHTISENVYYNV